LTHGTFPNLGFVTTHHCKIKTFCGVSLLHGVPCMQALLWIYSKWCYQRSYALKVTKLLSTVGVDAHLVWNCVALSTNRLLVKKLVPLKKLCHGSQAKKGLHCL